MEIFAGQKLVRIEQEPSEEERHLRQCLFELRLRCERDSKPYIDRLVALESSKTIRFAIELQS